MKKIHEINMIHKETANFSNNNNPSTIIMEPENKNEEKHEIPLEKNQTEEKICKKGINLIFLIL